MKKGITPEQQQAANNARQRASLIGVRIGEIAAQAGLGKSEIGRQVGMPRETISRIFSGRANSMQLDTALLLLNAITVLTQRAEPLTLADADVTTAPTDNPFFDPQSKLT